MSNCFIKDESSNHKYYTHIPNIIFELGLKANQIALYLAIKKSAGENGTCTKSRQKLCKESGVGLRNFPKLKESLTKKIKLLGKPLIRIEKRFSACGDQDTDCIYIVDIWAENMKFFLSQEGGAKLHGGSAKLHGGVEQNCMEGGAKLHPKEQQQNNNPYEEQQQPVVVFRCLEAFKDCDISHAQKLRISKKYAKREQEVIDAVAAVLAPDFIPEGTLLRALNAALKHGWKNNAAPTQVFDSKELNENNIPDDVQEVLKKRKYNSKTK